VAEQFAEPWLSMLESKVDSKNEGFASLPSDIVRVEQLGDELW
jgi:hypothetical protein